MTTILHFLLYKFQMVNVTVVRVLRSNKGSRPVLWGLYLLRGDFRQVLVQQFTDVLVHGGPDLLGGLLGLRGVAVVEGVLYHGGVAALQV